MIGTSTAPFGTPATRLHFGRIMFVVLLLVGAACATWVWVFHRGAAKSTLATESSTTPAWTIAQLQYEKPEPKVELPPAPPVDTVTPQLARILAALDALAARVKALEDRKPTTPTVVKETPKTPPPKKAPAPVLFVHHDVKDAPPAPPAHEYLLAPGTTKLPCIVETEINSDVEGYLTAKVTTNVYDTATGRHLLVPQGSTILGNDQSQQLLYGNERLPTISLTLSLPDGRSVDLGKAPITDQQGVAGLTGDVNNHWGRLFGAVFIGGALRGGTQALSVAMADAAGAGQVAAGYSSLLNQAVSPRIGRALDTRPTITPHAGQLCNVILLKPLTLPSMWQEGAPR